MPTFTGGPGADDLSGSFGADELRGLGGDDTLNGLAGSDDLTGAAGNDRLIGGGGADTLEGGSGNDSLDAGGGSDVIDGGGGRDVISGGGGSDTIDGGRGADVITANGGRDVIDAGGGRDVVNAGGGRDSVDGGRGRDDISGGGGADTLLGGGGADTIDGGRGADIIDGGFGNDILTGGGGNDRFVFGARSGTDIISDFQLGEVMDLTALDISLADLTISQSGADSVIDFSSGQIVLSGFDSTQIDASFFEVSVETSDAEASSFTGLDQFRADARFAGIDGEGYTVVVIDTGIDLNHPAFGPDTNGNGISDRIVFSQDFSSDRDGTANDVQGHGTNVSSIVGSSDPRFLGVAPGVDIIALQGLSNSGRGSARDIEAALQWAVTNAEAYNIVAVNLSLGPGDNSNVSQRNSIYGDEYQALANLGVVTTVAAGNDYFTFQEQGVSTTASDPNVISVGAVWDGDNGRFDFVSGAKDFTTEQDRVTSFSQRSVDLETIFAPGAAITGASPNGGFSALTGTSQAAPFIAGVAALAQDLATETLGRRLTTSEFEALLLSSADQIFDGDDEDDNVVNLGVNLPRVNVLNLGEAILALGGGAPTPTPPPPGVTDDFAADVGTTGRVSPGGSADGTIGTAEDQDWFQINFIAGQTYDISLDGRGLVGLSDPTLSLRNASGGVLTSNDDSNGTLNSFLEYTAQNTAVFYLEAGGFGATTGDYRLSVSSGSGTGDDFPGDNTTPSVLDDDGAATSGVIEASGDRDRHRLDVQEGNSYLIDLLGAGGNPLADPFLRLFDTAGNEFAANDDNGGSLNSQLLFDASFTGSIFVEAGAFADFGVGGYEITVLADDPRAGDGDIRDDSGTTATINVGGTFSSALDPAGDRDWIAVDLNGGSVYEISMQGSGSNALSDPLLRIIDNVGREVAFNDDFDGLDSRIETFSPVSSGRFFISAGSFADFGSGDYTVAIDLVGGGGVGDVPGDSTTTESISVGGDVANTLESEGDRDWFSAMLQAGRSYEVGLTGTTLSDPLLRAYDVFSNELASDDDSGVGLNSLLTFTASTTGEHFFSAGAFGDFGTGDYTLSLTDLNIADDFSGDTSTTGTLPRNASTDGAIDFAGDSDWFAFDVSTSGIYQFDAVGGSLGDPTLTVRDQFGAVIAFDDDGGVGLNSSLEFFADVSQTIYLDIRALGDSATGDYTLSSIVVQDGADDFSDGLDGAIGQVSIGGDANGELEVAGDRDVFSVSLEAGATYDFAALGTASSAGTLSDPTLTLFGTDGSQIDFDDDSGAGLESLISYTAVQTGDHFLSVAGFADTREGSYQVTATQTAAALLDDFADGVTTGGFLNADGGSQMGELEMLGDRDWFSVELDQGFTYTFDLLGSASSAGTLSDPFLRLRDADGSQVAFDDDSGEGLESRIDFTANTSGRFYLDVGGFSDNRTGSYQVRSELADDFADTIGDTANLGFLGSNDTGTGTLETIGDEDVFLFNPIAGASYDFSLRGADSGSGTLSDPFLRIFDSFGNQIAFDDDGGAGRDSQLTFSTASSQTAFVVVDSFNDNKLGTWLLEVDQIL